MLGIEQLGRPPYARVHLGDAIDLAGARISFRVQDRNGGSKDDPSLVPVIDQVRVTTDNGARLAVLY